MFPMRKAFVLILVAVLVSGCNFIYRQPVFQGNLLEKSNVEQLKPGLTQAQVVALLGSPPKVIWLRGGNQSTAAVSTLLRRHFELIVAFGNDDDTVCLQLY